MPDARAIYDAMNGTLADLHAVDVEAAGLGDFGRPGSYFERQLARWTSQYRASETGRDRRHGPADRLAGDAICRRTTARSRWSMATTGWTT